MALAAATQPGLGLRPRGPAYWAHEPPRSRRPEDTSAALRGEWFLTGDRARMAADGAIAHLGRADDLINAGGYRVSPQEVEAALLRHPAVADAAAVERPIRPGVSVVAAYYVAQGAPPDEAELAAHCAERLARYKCPRSFHRVPSLPRNANGMLMRRALRDIAPGEKS